MRTDSQFKEGLFEFHLGSLICRIALKGNLETALQYGFLIIHRRD